MREPVADIATHPPDRTVTRESSVLSASLSEVAEPLGAARWDWSKVRGVLVVRLRSIGDMVLATPTVHALRRFLPDARIDVLVEDWVAPLLEGYADVDQVITVERKNLKSRISIARRLRAVGYDVAYNLHGGSTATFLTRATGARHRVGYEAYRYSSLHNHRAPSAAVLWNKEKTHSVEQQLALAGWTGVPVTDKPQTNLVVTNAARESIGAKLRAVNAANLNQSRFDQSRPFALIHPAAAFATKTWAAANFARIIEYLYARNISSVAIVAAHERAVAHDVLQQTNVPLVVFDDLSLPEVTALASQARIFVGNDSGVAHIAVATGTPAIVVFGSSNVDHWRPWTPHGEPVAEVVREELTCQPCAGYACEVHGIENVTVEQVTGALARVLTKSEGKFSRL